MSGDALHLGIDIGTQGARAVLANARGEVVARGSSPLPVPPPGPVQEQAPDDWWAALVAAVAETGDPRARVATLAVSCTSGSVCAVGPDGAAVGPGLLYADRRCLPADPDGPSWATAKLRWLAEEQPEVVAAPARVTSPGGFVCSRLLGRPAPIDVTQALKFGWDPELDAWTTLAVPSTTMPDVVLTGQPLGPLDPAAARATGLPEGVVVVAGATDGVAGQLACRPSPTRWVTTIGSTIVWKAVSATRIDAAERGIYSHRGPDGLWLPGAASNAGARVLSTWATDDELAHLDGAAEVTPSTPASYPMTGRGERFPFVDPTFSPWTPPAPAGPARYASEILGAAFVERWGCEALVEQGCEPPLEVVTTGGASAARRWGQLRADVLQLPIEVPAEASSAFGAAVIAAAPTHGGVLAAGEAMVRVARRVDPDRRDPDRWSDAYRRFRQRCTDHEERR